ncbi:prepilin-type N-terminal cleavage/methylation domain-containing protein [Parageobacillus toebii NBRC 107807]|uniref:Type IV pilus assembly protein PilA n=1 Tax=Parageobacillus toebii NBRC 107807 TaxID=1223503 RepID=A0A6G9J010_9BACL|nr:prepilin-type N-terminal cleavage/methylation domain-containing protein [Parageobacillus toebii]MBB3867611.1 type IV pilus assembly protein PilA [Parageobacillus toebii NBRC 107807]QIQ31577.1 prepilin-type N-terminal cleavage/methylation domain-containing protein [Parageobacillus toebii NBRC 107807]
MIKRLVKNERGLTLIELLAVIVILGIIVAIAIPAIGAIIDNSKKDAHIANAKQMASAARLALSSGAFDTTKTSFTMQELYEAGYLEKIPKSPGNKTTAYDTSESIVTIDKQKLTNDDKSDKGGESVTYKVTLVGNDTGKFKYIDNKDVDSLTRKDVKLE